jgi:hypothetical protein
VFRRGEVMELNRDTKRRAEILCIPYDPSEMGDIVSIRVDAEQLHLLVDEGFADPEDAQNDSPSLEAFLAFMDDHGMFQAHGYAVPSKRNDYRISIEGLVGRVLNDTDTVLDFVLFCRQADELEVRKEMQYTYLRSWWD